MAMTGVRSREPIFPTETARSSKYEDNIEGDSVKLISIILSFAILFTGCYSTMPFTKNELAPDDKGAFFRLHDSSYIESDSGDHLRIEGGYKIEGELVKGDFHKEFEGVVRDNQIKEIAVKECDTGLTVFAVLLAASIPVWFVIEFYTGTWE